MEGYAHTFEVWADSGGAWRWRLRARNGKLVATAGESFATRASAKRAARAVSRKAQFANVVAARSSGESTTKKRGAK